MQITWSKFHRFTEDNVRQYAPSVGGVYLLWVKLKNGKWRCYYVGQAADLRDRLFDHLLAREKNKCIKKNVGDYISGFVCAKVSVQSNRDGIEKYLYDCYGQPECNAIDPGGEPIEVNIP